jgi:cyclopropane fatty-acyl-phospholipid synthase-like methyltransferase
MAASSSFARPEHTGAAEAFYDEEEARKYTSSTRIVDIQAQMAERCIELLALPPGFKGLVLDVGCGSGLSGGECVVRRVDKSLEATTTRKRTPS